MSSSLFYKVNSRPIRAIFKKKNQTNSLQLKDKIKTECYQLFKNDISENQHCGGGQLNDMESKISLNLKRVSSHLQVCQQSVNTRVPVFER